MMIFGDGSTSDGGTSFHLNAAVAANAMAA